MRITASNKNDTISDETYKKRPASNSAAHKRQFYRGQGVNETDKFHEVCRPIASALLSLDEAK